MLPKNYHYLPCLKLTNIAPEKMSLNQQRKIIALRPSLKLPPTWLTVQNLLGQLLGGSSHLYVRLEVRINGDRINGLFHLLINGIYWGCNPSTNLLLISLDIQAELVCG